MATFYLDIVNQVNYGQSVSINFGLYAVGDTNGGGSADIRIYGIEYGNEHGLGYVRLSKTVTVPSQTSGSAQIYSNRSYRVNGTSTGACVVVIEVDYKDSSGSKKTQVLKQYLERSRFDAVGDFSDDSFALGMIGMGVAASDITTDIVAGEKYTFVIHDESPVEQYDISVQLTSSEILIGTVSGTGLHDLTVPMAMCSLITTSESERYATVVARRKGTTQQGHFMATAIVPDDVLPTIGDIGWRDGNGHCQPGDGVYDTFATRISDILLWVRAEGAYGSTISRTQFSIDGVIKSVDGMFTEDSPADYGTWSIDGYLEIWVYVTDSRGRVVSKTFDNLLVSAYDYPSVTSSEVTRWDTTENEESDESTNVRTHLVGSISSTAHVVVPGQIDIYVSEPTEEPDWQRVSTTEVTPYAFEKFIDESPYDETETWRFKWVVTDCFGFSVSGETIVYGATPTIDVSPDGESIGFWTTAGGREDTSGKPINGLYLNGDLTLDEGMTVNATGGSDEGFMDIEAMFRPSFNYSSRKFQLDMLQNIALANDRYIAGYNPTGSLVRLLGMNASGKAELSWPTGGMSGRVGKQIWEGAASPGSSITVPELPYYNVFVIYDGGSRSFLAVRTTFGAASAIWGWCFEPQNDNIWVKAFGGDVNSSSPTVMKITWFTQCDIKNNYFNNSEYIKGIRGLL